MSRLDRKRAEWFLSLPSLAWLTVFFAVPGLIVFAILFKPHDPHGGIGTGWTLATLRSLWNPAYAAIAWRTLWLSAATTVLCLLLAVPAGVCIARAAPSRRRWLLLAVIVPFWTSSLVRIFSWKVLLHPDGAIKRALAFAGLVHPDALLLYNSGAVLLVLVYTFLPFAILPIYAAAEKFDHGLIEAARDLGATRFEAFRKVFLPGIGRGVAAAALIVFIPALGSYVVPDLVGGPTGEMIGNKIAQRTFVDRNLPHASGLSALLTLAVMAPAALALLAQRRGAKEAA